MRKLEAAQYRRMPWKNGGGETFQIAASPAGATLDAIDWRLSMAVVASDGPFSAFNGMDRTLTVLDGHGLMLRLDGDRQWTLRPQSAPRTFPGDTPAEAWLLEGPVTDLNVMTRRDRYHHIVRRIPVNGAERVVLTADVTALFCCSGTVECALPGRDSVSLRDRDCALVDGPAGDLQLQSPQAATLLLIEIYRTTA